jgi:hypothetical protein
MSNDALTIEERYVTANRASNLRCEADKTGAIDVIIASGMSPSRLGSALLRLRTEWDGSAHKRGSMSQTDMLLLMGQLTTLAAVREAVGWWARKEGMEDADKVVAAAIHWWLDKTCPACEGRGKTVIEGTPALSSINCKHCHGTGERRLSHGQAGQRVMGYMHDCTERAAQSIKSRLYRMR